MEHGRELQRLTYAQMRELVEHGDQNQVSGYISENMAILRGSPFNMLAHVSHAPFRFDEMRMLVIDRGDASLDINLRPMSVGAGDLVFASGGSIAQMNSAAPDIHGMGISCTDELLALAFDSRLPTILRRPQLAFVLHLDDSERQFLASLHSLLWQTVHTGGMSPQVTLRLAATILTYADHLYANHESCAARAVTHEEEIFDLFLQLVNQYGTTEHKLPFYASRLYLSQRYLGAIVKKTSGHSAKDWIDRELVTAIKVELRYTSKPLKEISDSMEFPNTSFFNKYFKRLTGQTPMQYRNG